MRILFAGTPQIAVPTLAALAARYTVAGVLTSPDKPGKRGKTLVPSAVKQEALALGLPVFQPEHLRGEERRVISSWGCDTLVCFAYGKLFGPKFLSLFPYAALNIHPSLLPALRGPAPIQNAILRMLPETGITIQTLALEMDAGDIVAQTHIPLQGDETTESLSQAVSRLAADLAVTTLASPLHPHPQEGPVSVTRLVEREDGLIDWNNSARAINAQVRALFPWPKAYTSYQGRTLFLCGVYPDWMMPVPQGVAPGMVFAKDKTKGLGIATGEGILWVTRLQRQQKNEMDAASFVNGDAAIVGSRLGGPTE
ncbi:MAG: methionyl-tRNA formyltransferase [Sphaerochaeta sp.]|nr:methionyl-tRNA formyltransferase [Sphaerochaeta sp.]MCI2075782.1 methionyl-tRNA formyltransferase [Sphaerochaeta sp.]MCI2096445.1 methionyl-tRNA formyltransferase [Sphaerochaeta sp.]MCI2103467.1 methionyl-tRNA formyltransferase [Sphaerochaeta sp.]